MVTINFYDIYDNFSHIIYLCNIMDSKETKG